MSKHEYCSAARVAGCNRCGEEGVVDLLLRADDCDSWLDEGGEAEAAVAG